MAERILSAAVAAGTTLTNSTDETVLGSYTIPAYFAQAGKVLRVSGLVTAPATNSTDTLQVRVRIGGTTLTGTAVLDSGAVDVANDDAAVFFADMVFREDADSSMAIAAHGGIVLDAPGTAILSGGAVVSSLDGTADLLLEVTGEWSVANAGNQCALQSLIVTELD